MFFASARKRVLGQLLDVVFKRKASDESVTSSTALQNDDDLFFSIGANEVWVVDFTLYVISASATPKIDYQVTVPASGVVKTSQDNVVFAANAQSGDVDRFSGASASEPATYVASSGSGGFAQLVNFHVIVVNSTNAGTVQLKWAQHVSNGTATIVQANSHMIARRFL